MEKTKNKTTYKLTLSAIFVALATVLSLIKVYQAPLGGSITLLSMLPIAMLSCMLGLKWGIGASFAYSLIQLFLGITLEGVLGWGLTPASLIGTILLDYILAFTFLGISGIFAKKGTVGICIGVAIAVALRFLCHFISGMIIFGIPAELVGDFSNVWIYSLCYNGAFMLPELILTVIGAAVLFRVPQIKKLMRF